MASVIDLDRVRRNDDRLSTLQLILSGAVDLDALKEVLRVNTKVSEVIIYVDESFLVELPVEETHDLFRTIGGMPNLQKLGFHSQSGSSGVLSIQALIAITSHAARMVHFGISDVALWGSQADFSQWATQLQTQLFLQSFCVCECELLEPSKECPLDPLLTVLSILPSLEALFLQAATPDALGQVSPEAVGAIGMAPQLQDLRLGNFELKHGHMEQLARVLPSNTVLTELKLDACVEYHKDTATAMAKILKFNRRLKSLELGLTSMMPDDCAVILAESLKYNTHLESFTLSRGANARFRPTISKACQAAFVDMLHHNYVLETLVLFQRFPVKKEFKLYLTLNKYGRGKLLKSHESVKEDWIQAIHKVNDDLDSIFYYLSINPSLCNHCDEPEEETKEPDPQELMAIAAEDQDAILHWLRQSVGAPMADTNNCRKRQRPEYAAASHYRREAVDRNVKRSRWEDQLVPQQSVAPAAVEEPQAAVAALMRAYDFNHAQAALLQQQHQQLAAAQHRSQLAAAAAALSPRQGFSPYQMQLAAAYGSPQLQHPSALGFHPQLRQEVAGFSLEQMAAIQELLALHQQAPQQPNPPSPIFQAALAFAEAAAASTSHHLSQHFPRHHF